MTKWYASKDVGKVYVFDGAKANHGSLMARIFGGKGYATLNVSSGSSDRHTPGTVYAGNFSGLQGAQRTNAIANSVIHETAAHHFKTTYANAADSLWYGREGIGVRNDPAIQQRIGTVADSFAYGDEATRSSVTGGPIPVHSGDLRTMQEELGPVQVEPPDND